jgi:hypothetical protein
VYVCVCVCVSTSRMDNEDVEGGGLLNAAEQNKAKQCARTYAQMLRYGTDEYSIL